MQYVYEITTLGVSLWERDKRSLPYMYLSVTSYLISWATGLFCTQTKNSLQNGCIVILLVVNVWESVYYTDLDIRTSGYAETIE